MSEENVPVDTGADEEVEFVPQGVLDGGRDFRVEGNDVSGYIGVDPEYMTYANSTEKPHLTDQERYDYTNQYDHLEGNADEAGEADEAETRVTTATVPTHSSGAQKSNVNVNFDPFA